MRCGPSDLEEISSTLHLGKIGEQVEGSIQVLSETKANKDTSGVGTVPVS